MLKMSNNRVEKNVPEDGCVRLLIVTEKQFGNMKFLVGDAKECEKKEMFAEVLMW